MQYGRSTPHHIQWTLLLLLVLWWALPLTWGAETPGSMRATIVFDISGSMRQNDPQRLSTVAAELFVDLAQPQDAIGLTTFSDRSVPLRPLTPLSPPATKTQLHTQLRGLKFTGQTTNLAAALEAGLASFPPGADKTHRDLVLLITDGQLDLGARRRHEEPALLAHIKQVLLPQYRQRGIALYTIAFTTQADQALLQEMARVTDGEFHFIPNAATLHTAFSKLFILARQSESFPLDQKSFAIDKSIQDISLVFAKRHPQEQIGLITPQHEVVHASNTPAGMTWHSTPSYDLVQMAQPEPGTWQVERSSGVQEGVGIVGTSTLSLHVELSPTYREVGEPLRLRAFLQDNGQVVRDVPPELTVHAKMSTPQGETAPFVLTPQSDGVFTATLQPRHAAGQYALTVMAASPTVQRQRTLSFTLRPQCFQATVSSAAPVTARLVLSNACPPFEALAIEAERTTDSQAAQRIALTSPRQGVFEAPMAPLNAGQTGQVTLHIRGQLAGQAPFMLVKGPWPLPVATPVVTPVVTPDTPDTPPQSPPPAPRQGSWHDVAAGAVRKLLVLNGVLVLVGGIGFGLYRYRSQHKKVPHARNADLGSDALDRSLSA